MTYIVAELGQNHNGSLDLARSLVDIAAMPIVDEWGDRTLKGVDAVKLCKRDLRFEADAATMSAEYVGRHSFGPTYGAHRRALELTGKQHGIICDYAHDKGLEFVDTLCAPSCIDDVFRYCTPDRLKVASRDLTNHPLLRALADTGLPLILSTGMHGLNEIDAAMEVIGHRNVAILHCLSEYPARYENLNLETVRWLRDTFLDLEIGYSDHTIGIVAPVAAVALGAEIIEKHITLSRRLPGSDHAGSLEADGLWRMVRDIRNLEMAMGKYGISTSPASEAARAKLERSIATHDFWIRRGERITAGNTTLLSPGTGVTWLDRQRVFGKLARRDIPPHTIIRPEDWVN